MISLAQNKLVNIVSDELMLRRSTLEDCESLFAIHVDSVSRICRSHYTEAEIVGWFEGRSPADYRGAIEAGGNWIALLVDKPIGFVEFFSRSISMLFVDSTYIGLGFGRTLMDFALTRVPGQDGLVDVEATLNSASFYEKFGFRRVGRGEIRRPTGLILETVLMQGAARSSA